MAKNDQAKQSEQVPTATVDERAEQTIERVRAALADETRALAEAEAQARVAAEAGQSVAERQAKAAQLHQEAAAELEAAATAHRAEAARLGAAAAPAGEAGDEGESGYTVGEWNGLPLYRSEEFPHVESTDESVVRQYIAERGRVPVRR